MPAREKAPARRRARPAGRDKAPQAVGAGRKLPVVLPEALSEFNESWNVMFGDSGSWKTATAGGAPRAVFLSTEKGTISAKRMGSSAKVIKCPTWDHVQAALNWIDENPGQFDVLIVDSLTKMQVLLMRWILQNVVEENEARDLDIPAIQDHQKWQNMFKRFVDEIIDRPVNTIFICTAMHKDDHEGDPMIIPDIQGKDYAISAYISAQMDMTLAIGAEKTDSGEAARRWILSEAYPPYPWCKDRFQALPRWVFIQEGETDTMNRIIASIEGSEEWAKRKKKGKASKIR